MPFGMFGADYKIAKIRIYELMIIVFGKAITWFKSQKKVEVRI